MKQKTEMVKEFVAEGNYKKALSIVKGFRLGDKDDLDKMKLAYECMVRPDFYRQLGKDVDVCIAEGIEILKLLYDPDPVIL